jgi:hypothetical protein
MNDINQQDQAYHYNNQIPKTFDEMCTYLLSKPNCSIQGGFFTIPDMHDFCHRANNSVNLIEYSERINNVMCRTNKGSMQRAFDAYLNGLIDNVGVIHKKPFSPH